MRKLYLFIIIGIIFFLTSCSINYDSYDTFLIGISVVLLGIVIILIILFRKTRLEGKSLEIIVHKRTAELESVSNNYKGIIWSVDTNGIVTTFKGQYTKSLEPYLMKIEGKKIRKIIPF